MNNKLSGVFAAVLTPMLRNGEPDTTRLVEHCRRLLSRGCDGLAILGTTGEANSLSVDQRIAVLDALAASDVPASRLLPGTGCCSLADTTRLTTRAAAIGVGGVLMLPPFYYKSVSDDGLLAAYAEVIERVGDAALKVYLYHFPQMSGVPLRSPLIARLRDRYPDTVVGLKDSSGDLNGMVATARDFPGFSIFPGSDELLLPMLRVGGAGCITACANIAAPLAARVLAAWRANDEFEADRAQQALTAVRQTIIRYPAIAALKEFMARSTADPAWRTLSLPLLPLNETEGDQLMADLQSVGFSPSGMP